MQNPTIRSVRRFTAERVGDVLSVTALTDVNGSDPDTLLGDVSELTARLGEPGVMHAVMDFHRVPYFGSGMLEIVLALWRNVRSRGGRLAVCNLSDAAQSVVRTVKFDTLWPICATHDDAVAAVRRNRA